MAVTVSAEGVRSPVAARLLARAAECVLRAEGVRGAMVSIALVSRVRIASLNARHLRRRGSTDVIAFAFVPERREQKTVKGEGIVGDIYIAPDVARSNARRLGVSPREELVRLVVHGVLHVLGYEHPDGAARERSAMWRRQEALLARALRGAAA